MVWNGFSVYVADNGVFFLFFFLFFGGGGGITVFCCSCFIEFVMQCCFVRISALGRAGLLCFPCFRLEPQLKILSPGCGLRWFVMVWSGLPLYFPDRTFFLQVSILH